MLHAGMSLMHIAAALGCRRSSTESISMYATDLGPQIPEQILRGVIYKYDKARAHTANLTTNVI